MKTNSLTVIKAITAYLKSLDVKHADFMQEKTGDRFDLCSFTRALKVNGDRVAITSEEGHGYELGLYSGFEMDSGLKDVAKKFGFHWECEYEGTFVLCD